MNATKLGDDRGGSSDQSGIVGRGHPPIHIDAVHEVGAIIYHDFTWPTHVLHANPGVDLFHSAIVLFTKIHDTRLRSFSNALLESEMDLACSLLRHCFRHIVLE